MGSEAGTVRLTRAVRCTSTLLIGIALVVLVRALPLDRAIDLIRSRADGLGFWGPIALGGGHLFAILALFHGTAFAFAAGSVFGLMWGLVTASLASTATAAVAFAIARFLARKNVVRLVRRHPGLGAVDRAIGAGGWRIVALVRLSPVIPPGLGGYLFGVTAIRFWPYILTSWLFALPATFTSVYLGSIEAGGVRSATDSVGLAGVGRGRTSVERVLFGIGLFATLVVAAYVVRLVRGTLRAQTGSEPGASAVLEGGDAVAKSWPVRTVAMFVFSIAMLAFAVGTYQRRDAMKFLFGPPTVTLREAYRDRPGGPTFDHSVFDALLGRHVDGDGCVDYAGLRDDVASLDTYVASIGDAAFAELGRDEKLALLINAYNAFTLRLILDHYPIKSIRDIPSAARWDAKRWRVGTMTLSLNEIEHEQIRPMFAEPRIHFALVCAAISCPKLRNEAYQAGRIDEQLENQARYAHSHDRWFRFEQGGDGVGLTKLYDWYGADFRQMASSVLGFAARYSTRLRDALDRGVRPEIMWIEYDWTLNDIKNDG